MVELVGVLEHNRHAYTAWTKKVFEESSVLTGKSNTAVEVLLRRDFIDAGGSVRWAKVVDNVEVASSGGEMEYVNHSKMFSFLGQPDHEMQTRLVTKLIRKVVRMYAYARMGM